MKKNRKIRKKIKQYVVHFVNNISKNKEKNKRKILYNVISIIETPRLQRVIQNKKKRKL